MHELAGKGYFIIAFVVLLITIGCFNAACKTDGNSPEKKSPSDKAMTGHDHIGATTAKPRIASLKPYQIDELYQKSTHCGKDIACYHTALLNVAEIHGPKASIELMSVLMEKGHLPKTMDNHDMAHHIGRKTAEHFGINAEALLLCPPSANFGCMHGFFQYALGIASTPAKVAGQICGSLAGNLSAKLRFDCYHGLGHGVMMAQEYNLKTSLSICDAMEIFFAQDGCWQGVFMENVNAGMRNDPRAKSFSVTDPLAPCNQVEERYRHECFINHAGWLMHVFRMDIQKATSACLSAPETYLSICLQSIGLMVTNASWQSNFTQDLHQKKFEAIAWEICTRFPEGHQDQCVLGGIDNILNFDRVDITRARNFCNVVDATYRDICYHRIGLDLRRIVADLMEIPRICAQFEDRFQKQCLRGAQI
ncbi:MAG: hypothetical protein HY201_02120 [Nitrospirae bacterium]|nr:hypothetical protein [Candidatus Troglogloeales bacterium]